MSSEKKYIRKFVILQGRDTPYSKENETKGHAKLEVRDGKGKITVNVEGLRHIAELDKTYKVSLLAKQNDRISKGEIGIIEIKENGKGKTTLNFNPKTVGKTDLSIQSFNGILVELTAINERENTFTAPLIGYMEKDDDSIQMLTRQYKVENSREEYIAQGLEKNEVESPAEEQKMEEVVKVAGFDKEIVSQENVEEYDSKEEYEEEYQEEEYFADLYIEQESHDEEPVDEEKILINNIEGKSFEEENELDEDIEGDLPEDKFIKANGYEDEYYIDEELESTSEDDRKYDANVEVEYNRPVESSGYSLNRNKEYERRVKVYNSQISNYTMNILKFFEKVEPFEENIEGYNWWEIEYERKNMYKGFLPYYNYVVGMYYPYPSMYRSINCQSLIKKYNHYIFGMAKEDNEVKYYVYGIPGAFTKEEQPHGGATGFTTWLSGKGKHDQDLGYWLLHIDAVSGKVVEPLKGNKLN